MQNALAISQLRNLYLTHFLMFAAQLPDSLQIFLDSVADVLQGILFSFTL